MVIVLPPVEANLFGFVDRADEQSNSNGEKLDFRERHLDVASDHESLVKDPVEHFDQTRRASMPPITQWRRHRFGILRNFLRELACRDWARTALSQQWSYHECYGTNSFGCPNTRIKARR